MTPNSVPSPERHSAPGSAAPTSLGRCRHRPGCLSVLVPTDDLVITADGPALAEHLTDVPFAQQPLFDVADLTS